MRMRSTVRRGLPTTIGLAFCLCARPSATLAQDWSWPQRGENLTALPADFPPERLSAVMRGFTQALGVRCTHCHVGEEGAPLSTYDFVSDANPNKDRARAMYRMLGEINRHLGAIEPSGAPVNMWCHTCHNGKPRPQTLSEALLETHAASGAEGAYARFVELRAERYGSAAYDFTAANVNVIARDFAALGDSALAVRLLEHNSASYDGDPSAQEGVGDVFLSLGDSARAARAYERALELAPSVARIRTKLQRARGG